MAIQRQGGAAAHGASLWNRLQGRLAQLRRIYEPGTLTGDFNRFLDAVDDIPVPDVWLADRGFKGANCPWPRCIYCEIPLRWADAVSLRRDDELLASVAGCWDECADRGSHLRLARVHEAAVDEFVWIIENDP